MRVKLNTDAPKSILTTDWARVSADDAAKAWIINRALKAVGHLPMFDIDDATDSDAFVVLTPAPDDYRGDMDAVNIVYPAVELKLFDNFELGYIESVFRRRDGRLLGFLTSYFGNNGQGGLAAQDFDPAPGVAVQWLD
jgi:hypothetical protein